MQTWLLPRIDLTPEQLRVVEMPPDEHRVVLGSPGSGKTQVLAHRAAYLAETYNIDPKRYRVFVFTNVIREFIGSGLEFLGLPEEVASTFDHWCRVLYNDYSSSFLPKRSGGRGIDFERIRKQVLKFFNLRKELRGSLDFVLVDEGQDLTPEVYEILSLASKHITVFVDPLQKIFQEGADESFILKKLNLDRRNATLLGAYRNAPYVAHLASYFISNEESKKKYLAQIYKEQKVRERPLCYVAPSFDKETDRLAEIVRQRQIMNERIGIIVPTNRLLHSLARKLGDRGITVETAISKRDLIQNVEVICNFGNNVPKVATYHQAKGLTFDTVLLPRLVESSFPWVKDVARQKIIFVGIARATQWVYLSTVEGSEFKEMDVLREAEKEGHLVIQYKDDFDGKDEREEDKDEPDDEPEDDFSVL